MSDVRTHPLISLLARACRALDDPELHPATARLHQEPVVKAAAQLAAAHNRVADADTTASRENVAAMHALAAADGPVRVARAALAAHRPGTALPPSLGDQPTDSGCLFTLHEIWQLVELGRGERWADALLDGPFGALVPTAAARIIDSISAASTSLPRSPTERSVQERRTKRWWLSSGPWGAHTGLVRGSITSSARIVPDGAAVGDRIGPRKAGAGTGRSMARPWCGPGDSALRPIATSSVVRPRCRRARRRRADERERYLARVDERALTAYLARWDETLTRLQRGWPAEWRVPGMCAVDVRRELQVRLLAEVRVNGKLRRPRYNRPGEPATLILLRRERDRLCKAQRRHVLRRAPHAAGPGLPMPDERIFAEADASELRAALLDAEASLTPTQREWWARLRSAGESECDGIVLADVATALGHGKAAATHILDVIERKLRGRRITELARSGPRASTRRTVYGNAVSARRPLP